MRVVDVENGFAIHLPFADAAEEIRELAAAILGIRSDADIAAAEAVNERAGDGDLASSGSLFLSCGLQMTTSERRGVLGFDAVPDGGFAAAGIGDDGEETALVDGFADGCFDAFVAAKRSTSSSALMSFWKGL